MILFGITGAIGHGKTSLADCFATIEPKTLHLESSSIIIEIADGMHSSLTAAPSTDIASINQWLNELPRLVKEHANVVITPEELHLPAEINIYDAEYIKLFTHIAALQRNPSLF